MSEPDLTTEVIGYRQWRVTVELELRAAHKSTQKWTRGDNTAVCIPDNDALTGRPRKACKHSPSEDCNCGIYALHDPSDFWYGKGGSKNGRLGFALSSDTDPLVSGVIIAWGALQVHHGGFRAQHARIVALALPESPRDAAVARAAASAYAVPCVPIEELPGIASEFGIPIPEELRPEKPEPKEPDWATFVLGSSGTANPFWTPVSAGSSSWLTMPQFTSITWGATDYTSGGEPASPPPGASKKRSNRQGPQRPQRPPKNLRPKGGR